jgi:phenylacetate-CoA ligase
MHQLYLSANHISRESAQAYVNALTRYKVTHLIAYSSSVSFLAKQVLDLGLHIEGLKVVITNAEALFPWQRDTIRKGLNTEVRETYGMAEMVAGASECSFGALHIWPEVGWIEVFSDTEELPLPPGDSGRFVCTGLLSAEMLLIRYEVGDRGRIAAGSETCRCGSILPIVLGIEGRTNDLLISADGRRIYWLNPIFYGLPVREAQIIQEALDRVRVRYVPAPDFTPEAASQIRHRLHMRMGEVRLILERVDNVPRSANGKFQAVICNLPPEQRGTLPYANGNAVTPR